MRGSVGVPVRGGRLVLVSFVHVLACRVLEFVVLLLRGERSKELEIVVLRVGCTNPIVTARLRIR